MARPYRLIDVREEEGVLCLQLVRPRMDEPELAEWMEEMLAFVDANPGRNVILCLGPDEPIFLYSVFLAKLVRFQRRVRAGGGRLKLADVSPNVFEIFQVCHLDHLFEIYADKASALQAFAS
jgi:anti-anti-sigma factor